MNMRSMEKRKMRRTRKERNEMNEKSKARKKEVMVKAMVSNRGIVGWMLQYTQ